MGPLPVVRTSISRLVKLTYSNFLEPFCVDEILLTRSSGAACGLTVKSEVQGDLGSPSPEHDFFRSSERTSLARHRQVYDTSHDNDYLSEVNLGLW